LLRALTRSVGHGPTERAWQVMGIWRRPARTDNALQRKLARSPSAHSVAAGRQAGPHRRARLGAAGQQQGAGGRRRRRRRRQRHRRRRVAGRQQHARRAHMPARRRRRGLAQLLEEGGPARARAAWCACHDRARAAARLALAADAYLHIGGTAAPSPPLSEACLACGSPHKAATASNKTHDVLLGWRDGPPCTVADALRMARCCLHHPCTMRA